jgi:1-acyl-sn-glycerol-3-phosphate acyltransferase
LKRIWYFYLKISVYLAALAYFRKVERNGTENIPRSGPLLLGVRHSNALMDPLVSGAYTPRVLNFLVRADVFKNPLIARLWASMNMMPIYRLHDGRDAMTRNGAIFARCHKILRTGHTLEIFPEGGHSEKHKLEPLKKGAARIALGALDGMTRENDIQIVPVGLNYASDKGFRTHLSVNYGQPLSARKHYDAADPLAAQKVKGLTSELEDAMRHQLLDLRNPAPYEEANAMRQALEIHHWGVKMAPFAFSKKICDRLVARSEDENRRLELVALQTEHAALRAKTGLQEAGLPAAPVSSGQLIKQILVHLPFFLLLPLGILLHAPMLIPASRSPRLVKDAMFIAASRFISGLFLTQFLYLLYLVLGWLLMGSFWWALAGVGGTVLVGAASLVGFDAWRDMKRLMRFRKADQEYPEESQRIREIQDFMSN